MCVFYSILLTMFEPLPVIRDDEETSRDLISVLAAALAQKSLEKNPQYLFVVRKKEWTVQSESGPIEIDNWRFNEYDFSNPTIQMPCRARGLFTLGNVIVARGYNKFFNQDEVAETKLAELKKLQGPFSVSTKENGCIIFLAGLEDGTLLVCSKNATGEQLKDGEMIQSKHVTAGHLQILQQLEKAEKSTKDLARTLYDLNVTAVTELCDDDFEEHVVEYPKELAGLYLHGLNFNTRDFRTYPMDRVKAFAEEWGFLTVSDLTFPSFDTMWLFLEERALTGTLDDREIEGFVIRAKRDGEDFLFKYKFSEPYYLYRQLREATIKLIDKEYPQTIRQIVLRLPKKVGAIVNKYLEFATEVFEAEPELKDKFLNASGIIKLRKRFLTSMGYSESDGLGLISNSETNEKLSQKLSNIIEATTFHYAIVPIASIGCGKTTTFKILSNLMPEWGHVQSDDYFKKALKFQEASLQALDSHQVAMIDKNHHKTAVRAELFRSFDAVENNFVMPNVLIRYVGVNFLSEGTSKEHWEFLQKRLIQRGENHQTLRVGKKGDSMSKMAKGFYDTFQAPKLIDPITNGKLPTLIEGNKYKKPDNEFSLMINVDCTEENSSLTNAKIILRELARTFPDIKIPHFSEEQWLAAFEEAKAYKPNMKFDNNKQQRLASPVYVGVDIKQAAITQIAHKYLQNDDTWNKLVSNDRVQKEFHVTYIHTLASKNQATKQKWDAVKRKFHLKANGQVAKENRFPLDWFFDVTIKKVVVVEGKLITFQVELGQLHARRNGRMVVDDDLNFPPHNVPHITVGTMNKLIAPVKSNMYLEKLIREYPETADGEYTVDGQKYMVWNVKGNLQSWPHQQIFTFYNL